MLEEFEKTCCRKLLDSLNDEELKSLSQTVTQNSIHISSRKGNNCIHFAFEYFNRAFISFYCTRSQGLKHSTSLFMERKIIFCMEKMKA